MNIHLFEKCAPTELVRAHVPGLFRTIKCASCQADVAPADVYSYTLQTFLTAAQEAIILRHRNAQLHNEVHEKRVNEMFPRESEPG